MFENVTFNFYKNTLGRTSIPDAETFESFKLENIQVVKKLLPFIIENETNGIDSAVCLMIEIDYKKEQALNAGSGIVASESLSGHSISFDNSVAEKIIELNSKSIEKQKLEAISLFNYLDVGIL